jgi:hypothetical protein
VSIIPGGEHQGSKDELSVVQELDAEGPRGHESLGRILSAYPFLTRLCQYIVVRYFLLRIRKVRRCKINLKARTRLVYIDPGPLEEQQRYVQS